MTMRYSKIDGIVKTYIEGPADEVSNFIMSLQERLKNVDDDAEPGDQDRAPQ